MPIRKHKLVSNEYYHCFNRGVDKRVIFLDGYDFQYFLDILFLFNQTESLGDIRLYRNITKYKARARGEVQQLVSIISYCLNPNHFHLILKQEVDDGITEFMRKIGTGYTMYFNKKYKRSGALFQGRFKSVLVESDVQLRLLLAYVSFNNKVHKISDREKYRSFIAELENTDNSQAVCDNSLVLSMFKNKNTFVKEAGEIVKNIFKRRTNLGDYGKEEFLE